MANRPTVITLSSGAVYNTATLNSNFIALRNAFDEVLGRLGTSGTNNTMTGDVDFGGYTIRNAVIGADITSEALDAQVEAAAASAEAAATSEANTATSETNAANSASAASDAQEGAENAQAAVEAIVEGIGFDDFVQLTSTDSPYAVTTDDKGKMLICDTSGGSIVINMETIANLGTPATIGVKKKTGDGSSVTVDFGGTDTDDEGNTSRTINTVGGIVMHANEDTAPDTWVTETFGAAAGNLTVDTFDGDGTTTQFTLSANPANKSNTWVFQSGVYQNKDTYEISGTTITFDDAPATGTDNVQVVSGSVLAIGTPADRTVTAEALVSAVQAPICDFRLTLTSGTPVTTSDVTGATIIYACPYKGNRISLYDGDEWTIHTSAEFSLALGTLTASLPYDVFAYDDSGTPTLEFTAWTDGDTRATDLVYQDGVLVKSGDATRRYLGTFYTTATTTTEDSKTKRYLWNYYHRLSRQMLRKETAVSWSYNTAAWRQANNNASNHLSFVLGLAEDAVFAEAQASCSNTTTSSTEAAISIGLDSTSSPSTDTIFSSVSVNNSHNAITTTKYCGAPAAGAHDLYWLEFSGTVGTTTWVGIGPSGASDQAAGIFGQVMA